MKILVLSINHGDQLVPTEEEKRIPEVMEKSEKLRAVVKQKIANQDVDLICEESDHVTCQSPRTKLTTMTHAFPGKTYT